MSCRSATNAIFTFTFALASKISVKLRNPMTDDSGQHPPMREPFLVRSVCAGVFLCVVNSFFIVNAAAEDSSRNGTRISNVAGRPMRLPSVSNPQGNSNPHSNSNSQSVTNPQRDNELPESSELPQRSEPAAMPWLPSTTTVASSAKALEKLERAKVDYYSKAWFSAEQSAWESIAFFSQSIDLRNHQSRAAEQYRAAKNAILEARDFAGSYAATDPAFIVRLAKSHQTDLITEADIDGLTAPQAADRYLDFARRNLAPLAAADAQCAEAIDFLAAIYLKRGKAANLAGETALCLRRAALQGQPSNANLAARLGVQLADIGLVDEAAWAMQHSLNLKPDPVLAARLQRLTESSMSTTTQNDIGARTPRFDDFGPSQTKPVPTPVITQLSPSEFASVSKPLMQTPSSHLSGVQLAGENHWQRASHRPEIQVPVSLVSTQSRSETSPVQTASSEADSSEDLNKEKRGNPIRRWFQSLRNF